MDRDDLLFEAARLPNIGLDLGTRRSEDPEILARKPLVAQLARCLEAPRVHPVLVGDPGVGKTCVVGALARAMAAKEEGLAPRKLHGGKIVATTACDIVSGALFANQLEHKLRLVITNCDREDAILLLDDVLSFVGAGSSSSAPEADVAALLAPFMLRGAVRVAATTTPEGWMQLQRLRPTFARLLTPLLIPETTKQETLDVLRTRARDWRKNHGVHMTERALEEAMDLAERLVPWKRLPGSACDLLDAALALDAANRPAVAPAYPPTTACPKVAPPLPRPFEPDHVAGAVHRLTGIPEFMLVPSLPAPVEMIRAFFDDAVLGQEHVVEALAARVQMVKARLCAPNRPLAAYLFAGPSGVGKTLMARTLAALLLGDERRLIRFDMSEFSTRDSVSRFLGDGRPGWHGSGLVDSALAEPFPIVLLDEIEKAHDAIFDVLLQILGEGRLTDERGRTAHFTNAIILMTSNLGANRATIEHPASSDEEAPWEARIREAMRRQFRPELVNRLTATFAFRHLSREEIVSVARREIARVSERKGMQGRFERLTGAAFEAVVRAGYSHDQGVRPMERAVDALVASPLARHLAEDPSSKDRTLVIDVDADGRTFVRVGESDEAPGSGTQESVGMASTEAQRLCPRPRTSRVGS